MPITTDPDNPITLPPSDPKGAAKPDEDDDEPQASDHAPEAARWRARATELESRVAALTAELDAARRDLETCHRRHDLDARLAALGAIDLDTARLLAELALDQPPADPDESPPTIEQVLANLRRDKAFLFRRPSENAPALPAASVMTAAPLAHHPSETDLDDALEDAALSGDRAALLRYLRLRRRF